MKTAGFWMSSPGSPWFPRNVGRHQPILIWTYIVSPQGRGNLTVPADPTATEVTPHFFSSLLFTTYSINVCRTLPDLDSLVKGLSSGSTLCLALALYSGGECYFVKSWEIAARGAPSPAPHPQLPGVISSYEYGLPEFRAYVDPIVRPAIAGAEDKLACLST